MTQWFIANAGLVGLLFFFGVFVAIAVWLFLICPKNEIESNKFIPLEEDANDLRS